jgi:hypothetical protein
MSRTYNQLPKWNIRSVSIEPSLKWTKLYTFSELCNFADRLQSELPELSIEIFKSHGYCNEVDGPWNVCIAVHKKKIKEDEKSATYMYMVRRDNSVEQEIGGTYGCPFQNNEYIQDINHRSISNHPEYLAIIETKLEELMGKAARITHFHT